VAPACLKSRTFSATARPDTTKLIYAHYTPQTLRRVVLKHSASADDLVAELEAERETA